MYDPCGNVDGGVGCSPTDWQWIFIWLWKACALQEVSETRDKFLPCIKLRLPDTILFQGGQPKIWLASSDEGFLVRRKFRGLVPRELRDDNHVVVRDKRAGRRQDLVDNPMYSIIGILQHEWQKINLPEVSLTSDTPICVAWYSDGRSEVLDSSQLKVLTEHRRWTTQLIGLQAYVAPLRLGQGIFNVKDDAVFGSGGSLRNGPEKIGLNMLTKAIAMHAMRAYARGEEVDTRLPSQKQLHGPKSALAQMRTVFIVDRGGKLWFSHAEEVQMVNSSTVKETTSAHGEGTQQKHSTSQRIAEELKRLIQLAHGQGVSMLEAFAHFDTQGLGYADVSGLQGGLARLGIGIAHEVATDLIELIGGRNSAYFQASDLTRFCTEGKDRDLLSRSGSSRPPICGSVTSSKMSPTCSKVRTRSLGRCLASLNEGGVSADITPLPGDICQVNRGLGDQEGKNDSSPEEVNFLGHLPYSKFTDLKELKPRNISSDKMKAPPAHEKIVQDQSNEFPGQTVQRIGLHGLRTIGCIPHWSELPLWARNSTRCALEELLQRYKRLQEAPKESTLGTGRNDEGTSERTSERTSEGTSEGTSDNASMVMAEEIHSSSQDEGNLGWTATVKKTRKKKKGEVEHPAEVHCNQLDSSQDTKNHKLRSEQDNFDPVTNSCAYKNGKLQCSTPTQEAESLAMLSHKGDEDCKFHAGGGNILTFRWIKRVSPKPNHRGTTLQSTAALDTSHVAMGLPSDQQNQFLLIVLPDLFMTLGTMEESVGRLLDEHPRGKLLVVGLLGAPGTSWVEGAILHSDLQASALSSLLLMLQEKGELTIEHGVCVAMMGLGAGANILLHFAGKHLSEERHTLLRQAVRFLVLVNPFPLTPVTDSANKDIRRSLGTIKLVLEGGSHDEQLQVLATMLFSENYLVKHGRHKVLEQYWSSRRGLALPQLRGGIHTLPGLQPKRQDIHPETTDHERQHIPGRGVVEAIIGVMRNGDISELCQNIHLPVLLLSSTNDKFSAPDSAKHLQAALKADLVSTPLALINGNRRSRLLVRRISAGREVFQESQEEARAILMEVIQATRQVQIHPGVAEVYPKKVKRTADILDVLENLDVRPADKLNSEHQEPTPQEPMVSMTKAEDMLGKTNGEELEVHSEHGIDHVQGEQPVGGNEAAIGEVGGGGRSQDLTPTVVGRGLEKKRARRARDADVRKERAAERKKRKARLQRQKELAQVKKERQEERDRGHEAEARLQMQSEDECSRAAEKFIRYCEAWALGVEGAKLRALELTAARDERGRKAAEDMMTRRQAKKHLARLKDFHQHKLDMLNKDVIDVDTNSNLDWKLLEVDAVRKSCQTMLEGLHTMRHRAVEALRLERVSREQLSIFQEQHDKVENKLRELERLRRIYTSSADTASVLGEVTSQGLQDIDIDLSKQYVLFSTYQSVLKERSEIWEFGVRRAQKLKIATRNKEAEVKRTTGKIQRKIALLHREAGHMRAQKGKDITLKNKLEKEMKSMEARYLVLVCEAKLVAGHKGKFVDTDVWQAGVMQRTLTADLKEYLKVEQARIKVKVHDVSLQLQVATQKILDDARLCQEIDRKVQNLTDTVRATDAQCQKMVSHTLAEELEIELQAQQEAMLASHNVKSVISEDELLQDSEGYWPEKIRSKSSRQRTTEEKLWVGLDILINPAMYESLSDTEKEELQLDDGYKTDLNAEDVMRIIRLPHEIQLALPHLKSLTEIQAHHVLTLYTHGHGETTFARENQRSQEEGSVTDDNARQAMTFMGEKILVSVPDQQLKLAGTLLSSLLMERELYRMRAASALELSQEMREYMSVDKVLNPHLWPENQSNNNHEISINCKPPIHITGIPNPESFGDIYDQFRDLYRKGQCSQENIWTCTLSRQRCLEVWEAPVHTLAEEEKYVRNLMSKFYVPPETSRLGRLRIAALSQMKGLLPKNDADSAKNAKTYGSWATVHPASVGSGGQDSFFSHDGFDSSVVHPGSFACQVTSESRVGLSQRQSYQEHIQVSRPAGRKSLPEEYSGVKKGQKVMLLNSLADISTGQLQPEHETVLIRTGMQEVLRVEAQYLKFRESRSHAFRIADVEPEYLLDFQVTIEFKGCMGIRGFSHGRISAILHRSHLLEDGTVSSRGEAIGYAPHSMQVLNSGDQFHQTPGRIVILHKPSNIPLSRGMFQVVVSAVGATEYSVTVTASQCENLGSLAKKGLEEAKEKQVRLQSCCTELENLWDSIRLQERKYHACKALIEEAESERKLCEETIDELCGELRLNSQKPSKEKTSTEKDDSNSISSSESGSDSESSLSTFSSSGSTGRGSGVHSGSSTMLSEEEREAVWADIAAVELEYTHWGRLFTSRCQEKEAVKNTLDLLMKLRRDRIAEKTSLEEDLEQMRRYIPTAYAVLDGPKKATEVALTLNTSLQSSSAAQKWATISALRNMITSFITPAEEVRSAFQREGWDALTLEEQQWVVIDQSLCPEKYTWLELREKEKKERRERRGMNPPKKKKSCAAIEQYRFHRDELRRIISSPFSELTWKEKNVRKLLNKFHDNPKRLRQRIGAYTGQGSDPMLAQKTRQKKRETWTNEEREWVELDKILNPQAWRPFKMESNGFNNFQDPFKSSSTLPRHGKKEVGSTNISGAPSSSNTKEVKGVSVPGEAVEYKRSKNPFTREELLEIWNTSTPNSLGAAEKKNYCDWESSNQRNKKDSHGKGSWQAVRMGQSAGRPEADMDERLCQVQREIDKVSHNSNPGMDSSTLHDVRQRYPTPILRLELEAELTRLLREQIQQRERKNFHILEDISSSDEEGSPFQESEERHRRKRQRRKERRLQRRAARGDLNILAARKRVLLHRKITPFQKQNAKTMAKLGPGGCLACVSKPCKFKAIINTQETEARLQVLSDELHFARTHTELVVESLVPKSVRQGGSTTFRREDLIQDLVSEQKHLRFMLKLHFIDSEFHEANRTTSDHVECVALHGYRTLLWTQDAKIALEREQHRLVAHLVAIEITDSILEWMLEGWHFGERKSKHQVVPHIKKDGSFTANVDKKVPEANSVAEEQSSKEQKQASLISFTLPPNATGSAWQKTEECVVKPGSQHDKEITSMEKTMRFGLFCVALMYFRAQWLLKQQREGAAAMKRGWDILTGVPVRAKRKASGQYDVKGTQAGYQRVKVRKEKEQAEVLADFAGFLAVEKKEVEASCLLQKVYRGHIGRRAANKWKAKRAEYRATNSLMVSAAITMQRLLRGYIARKRARMVRSRIAKWLMHLVDDEHKEFEEQFYTQNKLQALKKGIADLAPEEEEEEEEED